MQRAWRWWRRELSTAVSSTARFETAALGSPASDESTVGTALGDPWQCSADCSSCCSLVASVAVALVAPRPANGARANGAEVVPRFFASGSQVTGRASGAAANTSAEQWPLWVSSSHVAGVIRDVAGLRLAVGHAPFAAGDIIEPTTGWSDVEDSRGGPAYALRGERFRATACCQPPPPPSSARTARPYLRQITHDVHDEGGAESTVRSSDSRARWAASSKAAPKTLPASVGFIGCEGATGKNRKLGS